MTVSQAIIRFATDFKEYSEYKHTPVDFNALVERCNAIVDNMTIARKPSYVYLTLALELADAGFADFR